MKKRTVQLIFLCALLCRWTMAAAPYESARPEASKRHFTSQAVEQAIARIKPRIKDQKLAWMFENCLPSTLDGTVYYSEQDGKPNTFVITGDINAMWLRDSGAQVFPYLSLCNDDGPLRKLIAGVIRQQTKFILVDPYANAFLSKPGERSEHHDDLTEMKPYVFERKWEIDSPCYAIRLAYNYWKTTGDISVFDADWQKAMRAVYRTFVTQQRKQGLGDYKFQRRTPHPTDSKCNKGYGSPVNPVGLIVSSFRPSDDATSFEFLVPSNFFAVTSLRQVAEISRQVTRDTAFASQCAALADEVETALKKYAVVEHPKYGKVYAFEVDGYGSYYLMDDANIPSLLAMPYLGAVSVDDPIYRNTRKMVWSLDNPYFFKGKAGEGIGGPHIGFDMIWPMSLIMKAMTSTDDKEIAACIKTLRDTDAGTGFMHESFNKNDPEKFTRSWFAWANTLFGELVMNLDAKGKIELLNNLE